jgi:hypothetical protein
MPGACKKRSFMNMTLYFDLSAASVAASAALLRPVSSPISKG